LGFPHPASHIQNLVVKSATFYVANATLSNNNKNKSSVSEIMVLHDFPYIKQTMESAMTKMIDEVPHEQVVLRVTASKSVTLWVSADGSVTTYNNATKSYDDLTPTFNSTPRDDIESRMNFMNDYYYLEFHRHRFLLCDIVARAYHPDYESHSSLSSRYQFFFRDNNPENCSVGNIIMKIPTTTRRVAGVF